MGRAAYCTLLGLMAMCLTCSVLLVPPCSSRSLRSLAQVGNSWRTDADLFAVWDAQAAARLKLPPQLKPVMRALQVVEGLSEHAGPGG